MTQHGENQEIINLKSEQICQWCGHDANAATAIACEVCGRSLESDRRLASDFKSTPRWLGVACLTLLVSGIAWIWKPWHNQETASTSVTRVHPSSDLQIFQTMREVQNVPPGLFSYGGALPFATMARNGIDAAIAQAHPSFRLRYTEPLNDNSGTETGITMLINGDLSFAQSSRPIEDTEYTRAKERNVALEQVPVSIDGVAFYTHPNLSIPGLSIEQLQNIFRGKVTNWNQVGGPDLPIVPISLDPASTTTINILLGTQGEDLGRNVQVVRDDTTAIRQVADTAGAISYTSASTLIGQQQTVRAIGLAKANARDFVSPLRENGQINTIAFQNGSYPMTRRLFVVIRRDGTLDEQAGVAYANLLLSNEGQKIIEKAGFVPLY